MCTSVSERPGDMNHPPPLLIIFCNFPAFICSHRTLQPFKTTFSAMTLIIEVPKTEEEFYRIAEIRSLAFGSHPFIEMLFPRHATHEGRVLLRDRLLEIQKMPSARFLIVRDTETSEIISQAEWHFYPPESKGDVMDLGFVEGSEDDKEFARHILGNFQAKRRAAIADTSVPLICMFLLTLDLYSLSNYLLELVSN